MQNLFIKSISSYLTTVVTVQRQYRKLNASEEGFSVDQQLVNHLFCLHCANVSFLDACLRKLQNKKKTGLVKSTTSYCIRYGLYVIVTHSGYIL